MTACGVEPAPDGGDCLTGKCDEGKTLFRDVTADTIGETSEWSNKVELADVDGDGRVDLLFANGGNYNLPSPDLEPNRIFLNRGAGKFEEVTNRLGAGDLARVIKARDISGDGIVDILVGTTYQTQSRLYLGTGGGNFTEVTATHLPQGPASIGDLEFGDVDGDGDLDVVLADWGPGDPFESEGAPVKLWLNSGDGHFTASAAMPAAKVQWSWDLELFDVDNDLDLDVMVSCKTCTGGKLYLGDGRGGFTDNSSALPQFTNNYEFEPIDIDGDGFLDVVTINDGEAVTDETDRREHLFKNSRGSFTDATATVWPDAANIGADDNGVAVADIDSDGDPDFLIGALMDAPDRLLINDGGKLRLHTEVFDGVPTEGTLGIALADLNGDGKLDAVQAQGEIASDERVYFGSGIAKDTAAPKLDLATVSGDTVRVRIHDNKSPVMPHDFKTVELRGARGKTALRCYGGALWRATSVAPGTYTACATDAAGNEACTNPITVE